METWRLGSRGVGKAVRAVPRAMMLRSLRTFLLCIAAAAPVWASQRGTADAERLRMVQAQLDHAREEKRRWQHVIDIEKDLTQHPDKFSRAADDASKEVRASGEDLMVEGITGGLCSSMALASDAFRANKELARRYKVAAVSVKAAYTDFIKERVISEQAGQTKPSAKATANIEKLADTLGVLKLAIEKDKKLGNAFGASVGSHIAALQFLAAYLNDDEKGMQKYYPATQSMLEATREIFQGLSSHREDTLEGVLKVIAKTSPEFEVVAQKLARVGAEPATLFFSGLNLVVGAYGFARGMQLSAQADEIKGSQMEAARKLHELLPKARRELAAAEREERRLAAAVAALQPAADPPAERVLPSELLIDNAIGVPARDAHSLDVLFTVNESVPMAHGFTPEGLKRLSEQFKDKNDADRARREEERRAAERASRQAAAEAAAARRRASEMRSSGSSSNGGSSSSGREYNMQSHDLSRARQVVANISNVHFN